MPQATSALLTALVATVSLWWRAEALRGAATPSRIEGATQEPRFSPRCGPFPGRRVVLLSASADYAELVPNWHGRARRFLGPSDQLVVVAEDEAALSKLRATELEGPVGSTFAIVDPNGTLFKKGDKAMGLIDGVPPGVPFGSPLFNRITGRRPGHILAFLEAGCTVLYSDVDLVWKEDVLQDIVSAGEHDLYITDDNDTIGNDALQSWYLCSCFLYLQPTPPITALVRDWVSRVSPIGNDQRPLNAALRADYESSRAVDFTVLPYEKFPPGCHAGDFPEASAVHANYQSGLRNKVRFLEEHGVWQS